MQRLPKKDIGDIRVMQWIVPWFGVIIPNLSGLFGPLGRGDWQYWTGYVYFIASAFAIWWGNRFIYLRQRDYYDWFSRPFMRIVTMLFGLLFYTAPFTLAMCVFWFWWSGVPADNNVVVTTELINVIAVIFITNIYETTFLLKDWEDERLRAANLEKLKANAELEALKNQVDPHFMFNSLNTLSHFIAEDPKKARLFLENLSDMYRYILKSKDVELVRLEEEQRFLKSYIALMHMRFGKALSVYWPVQPEADRWFVPPISLQILFENALKHNQFSEKSPLRVSVLFENERLVVQNPKSAKPEALQSSLAVGLKNLDERFRLITGQGIEIEEKAGVFSVKLPLVKVA
jgi:sensor histidine kinase YesM